MLYEAAHKHAADTTKPTHRPQVFAAGEDTLLAPIASQLQQALAHASPSSPANEEQIFEAHGRRYLAEMRARAPGGSAPDYVVDKMLVGSCLPNFQ